MIMLFDSVAFYRSPALSLCVCVCLNTRLFKLLTCARSLTLSALVQSVLILKPKRNTFESVRTRTAIAKYSENHNEDDDIDNEKNR